MFSSTQQRRKVLLGGLSCIAIGVFAAFSVAPKPVPQPIMTQKPPSVVSLSKAGGFVGSTACKDCHTEQHASWHRSYHRTMTQHATPDTVVAPFRNEQLEFEGQQYSLSREADRFYVSVSAPYQATHSLSEFHPSERREVVMTTGSHHMQVYWISDPASQLLIEFPFYYHIAEQRWILRDDTMLHPPNQPQIPSVWNSRCIKCHSVNGVPGLDDQTGRLSTHVAELGIACEACHGPGERHVAHHKDASLKQQTKQSPGGDFTIVNPHRLDSKAATHVCGRCHSATTPHDPQDFMRKGLAFLPGDDLHDFVTLNAHDPKGKRPEGKFDTFVEHYPTDGYWKDGTCRVGGDEYNAMIESPCYQHGTMSCISCHSMHKSDPDDQLAVHARDNRACTQCHTEPKFNEQIAEHTHHLADSAGSLCYNCHMPHTSYALLKAIRNHRISRPDVVNNVATGKPNACNLCHLDQTLKWTSGHLADWYGTDEPSFSSDEETIAASVLWLHQGDAALRIITAWHMGWGPALAASGKDWQPAMLATLLNDPYSAIRFVASRSLRSLPGFEEFAFDFLASPRACDGAVSRAIETWRSTRSDQTQVEERSVLLDQAGNVKQEEIDRLRNGRNNQPVSIAE